MHSYRLSFRSAGFATSALFISLILFALLPATSSSRTTRAYEGSLGSFESVFHGPTGVVVDQSNGDVYAVHSHFPEGPGGGAFPVISRFAANGTPKNFTAGPSAGTNDLTDFIGKEVFVAVDNSGGPLKGTIYVVDTNVVNAGTAGPTVEAFASSGAHLGTIAGSGILTPGSAEPGENFGHSLCGLTLDQANGTLYLPEATGNLNSAKIWSLTPSSPSGSISDSDFVLTGMTVANAQPCKLAADSGSLYVAKKEFFSTPYVIERFDSSSFTSDFLKVTIPNMTITSELENPPTAIAVDPGNGDLYVNVLDRVTVFNSNGEFLYAFGAPAYFANSHGFQSVAVKSALSGPASKVYVADSAERSSSPPLAAREIDVFGGFTKVPTFTHKEGAEASFGPDGTSGSSFSSGTPGQLAFDQVSRRLYAADGGVPGIYGFDASSPIDFPALPSFSPLGTAELEASSAVAVDNTVLPSAGNVYLVSRSTDLLYGWDSTGTPLAGAFPVDPAASPGAPEGSPKDLCGAAVDSQGNVWVSNSSTQRILKYSSAGASLPGSIDTSTIGSPCNLAFDSDDDLYVGLNSTQANKSGVWLYTAASGYTSTTRVAQERPDAVFAVDPSTDRLYVTGGRVFIKEFAFKAVVDVYGTAEQLIDEFTLGISGNAVAGIAVDATNGFFYVADKDSGKVHAFPPGLLLPEAFTRPASERTNTSATLNGLVNGQGIALTDCDFEFVTEDSFRATGFSDLSSGGSVSCDQAPGSIPLDLEDHPVSGTATGLTENTVYRFRLRVSNADGTTNSEAARFLSGGRPGVETTGSPVRTATTARLDGRVHAHGDATTYHFEYGTAGPCDANPCQATEASSAGSGEEIQLVSRWVEDLQPGTTYHYRLVAENGNPLGTGVGKGMTLTTRASDKPLSHGPFPGPPGSDRAYEQVSLPDTGGNPVGLAFAVSDAGDRAFYRVTGGTPISNTGSAMSLLYAEREETGPHQGRWRSQNASPPREELVGGAWVDTVGRTDLTDQVTQNFDTTSGAATIWRLRPGQAPVKILQPSTAAFYGAVTVSEDASRVLALLRGAQDPAHPPPNNEPNLYDVSSGTPQLVGLMPDGSVPHCGALISGNNLGSAGAADRASRWISPDGSLAFFRSCNDLYIRDLVAGETTLVGSGSRFVKSTPGDAYFITQQSFDPADMGGYDLYRYDIATEIRKCVSCVVPHLEADLSSLQAAVSEDGSRAYFVSNAELTPGAATPGIYRVSTSSGELAYVGPAAPIGDEVLLGQTINPDGSALIFTSNSSSLNAIGGQQNGNTKQYYLYSDRDRSLSCLSCPQDGSAPIESVAGNLLGGGAGEEGANRNVVSDDGRTVAFTTSTALVPADQNTARPGQKLSLGTDVYEWRDGKLFLVTDGLTTWTSGSEPSVNAVTPSGQDILFTASAQYTPDAIDGFTRLYDARIGGGFVSPPPPKPCPLEVCQGTPKGPPEEQAPGTGAFTGPGNTVTAPSRRPCPKGTRKARKGTKTRCVKRQAKRQKRQRANHDRRAKR
jgi:hypothetical protein